MSVSSPISPVLDQLTDLALWEAELAADPVAVMSSLVGRLERVPDRRARRGRRHPLLVIVVLTACATLVVGNDSVAAIWQWAAGAPQEVLKRVGARFDPLLGRFTVPSERTFRRVLAELDADALDLATCRWAADVMRGEAPTPVIARTPGPREREERRAAQRTVQHPAPVGLLPAAAIDGKALCGARTTTGRVFLVAAIAHITGVVLGQRQVPNKRGEGAVVHELLAPLDLAGMVLTLDALRTTKKTARMITGQLNAHYLLILKGNQPLTYQATQALLTGTDDEFAHSNTIENDQGHARTERRTLRTAPADDTLSPATQSPACPAASPAPNTSTTTSGNTGAWKTVYIGSRRDLPRRQLPAQNRHRTPGTGQFPQPGTQRLPPERTRQHRPRTPRPPRPQRRLRRLRHLRNRHQTGHKGTTPGPC